MAAGPGTVTLSLQTPPQALSGLVPLQEKVVRSRLSEGPSELSPSNTVFTPPHYLPPAPAAPTPSTISLTERKAKAWKLVS